MESYLNENFGDVKPKNSSEEALRRWRELCWLVKNPQRRFRFTANLSKRSEAEAIRRANQENSRVAALLTSQAAGLLSVQGQNLSSLYTAPEEVQAAGFEICADELASIVEVRNVKKLNIHGGVEGIADKLTTSINEGISTSEQLLNQRKEIYGINKFTESPVRGFWTFVWEALQDKTLMILAVCALVLLVISIIIEGWPKGSQDGIGIIASILLVVFVTATSDYKQSLQFKDLDREKKKITIQVTRNGCRQMISIYDLLAGDIVHLNIGDQVPADGLFVSGYSLLIDESSLTGESGPVNVDASNPFLLSGTKVQDGSCKMLVTTVGMRTQWGKLVATLSEGGDDETPLQVKLNGLTTIIGKIGLCFAVVTFAVLVLGLFNRKLQEDFHWTWSGDDAMEILEFFAVAVTIVVVAVPEGLSLAVTLSLAFAMRKMMNDKALVCHLAACETMGSATTICSDKTGTLTTSHMTVVKACICGKVKEIGSSKVSSDFLSGVPVSALRVLLQSIFNNTGGEVVRNKVGKIEILGTPTETALLEFGLSLCGNFQQERPASKIVQVEPFNSVKKRMGVVLQLPDGSFRAHCKGASEIILAECDKVIDSNGEAVPLHEQSISDLRNTIENFASEGLRTLCLAYKEIGSDYSVGSPIPIMGYTCIGIVGIKDPVRAGVRESIAICRSAGITVRMVTGDNINTAKAIARECGILTDGIAIEGHEFREKSEVELLDIIPKIQVMARSTPMDKLRLVKLLRKTFEDVVAVTGDGTNDAPALHEADIGIAMGIAGTEVAKESADVIILDDNFCTILTVAKWGRSVYINIQKFVQFQLTVNIAALIVNFSSACLTGNAPLTAVQLLWVNLIMDTLGALALATEPPTDDLMTRPPVGRKGGFISNVMWRNILGQSLYQFVIIWFLLARGKVAFHLDDPDSDSVLNTLIFNSFVFCQVFNEISCREMERINVFNGILKNYVFVAVFTCTILFQIMIIECLGTYANTYPLSLEQWFGSVFLGFLGMPTAAALKLIPANYTYTGQNFSDLIMNDSTSSAFIDQRSGESRGALSESRRLLDASASENSDDLIRQFVSDLGSHSIDKRKAAATIIRLLAKDKPEYRLKIAKAGAVKPLISLMFSPDLELQETSVTSILNLSLCDENKELIASGGGIKPLVGALETGTSTAKENAACALIHLSQIEKNKIAIGRSGAIPLLVDLLKKGSLQGKKDASAALYYICLVKENKMRAVQAGITKPLVELMDDFGSNMVDKSACVLSVLALVPEGRRSLVDEGGIPVLVKIVDVGSQLQKEIAVIILSHICEDNVSYLNTVALEGAIPPLISLSRLGTNLAKQKAQTLLVLLRLARTGNAAARVSEVSV